MSSRTENYNLVKPNENDSIDSTIVDLSNSFTIIDTELNIHKSQLIEQNLKLNTLESEKASNLDLQVSNQRIENLEVNTATKLELNSVGEQVNLNNQVIQNINKKVNEFDFTTVSPSFYEQIHLPSATVMQCMVINEDKQEMYVSQLDGAQTGVETYLLIRLSLEGVYLDHMKLINGGHGTAFGIENVGHDVYIWSNYENSAGTTYDLVRFKYVPNTIIDENSSLLERYDKFTDKYVVPVTDQKNGLIAFRISNSNSIIDNTVELRNLTDVKNGNNVVLHSYDVPQEIGYLQGLSIDGTDLYWYSGDALEENYPSEITLIDMETGNIKRRVSADFGKGVEGKYEGDFKEPESIYLYTDPQTGAKSLFVGMVTGLPVRRNNKIYAYHSLSNESKFLGLRSQKTQGFALTNSDGSAKRIPLNLTKLSDLKEVGVYYFSSLDSPNFTDFPTDVGGGYIIVMPPAPNNGTFQQILYRHSDDGNFWAFRRQITNGATPQRWYSEPVAGTLKWNTLPLSNGATNVSGYPLEYAISGSTGYIRGRVNVPSEDGVIFANIPKEARPSRSTYWSAPVAGTTGIRKCMIDSLGNMGAYGVMANGTPTFLYLDFTYPLRNE